ncbi:MAG: 50S ribosomal protein L11 methyltransferase [Thermoplasmata archaeon]
MQALERVTGFARPEAASEQVVTPPAAAAELLYEALARGDLEGRSVLDLGSGTGRLTIGAALLGAREVIGVEQDTVASQLAHDNAARAGVGCVWVEGPVADYDRPAETVIMNPPFGAQRKHADAPFWNRAFALAERAIYAFSLVESRTFIARQALARAARIEATRPVRWELPATFPHHRKPRVPLSVDLWVLRMEKTNR